jgi:tetratricopeptide (TPR) repeat protein
VAGPVAFERVSALLERERVAQEPRAALERVRAAREPRVDWLWVRVGARMARVVEEALGRERVREYPARGPLALVEDYLEVCEARGCPEALRLSEGLRADVRRLAEGWRRARVEALERRRLDEVEEPESLWPELEARAGEAVREDMGEELVRVAAGLGRRGQPEAQRRWLERAVALQPRSAQPRLALAEVLLEAGQEAEAQEHLRVAFTSLEGARVLSAPALLRRASRAGSPRVALGLLRAAVSLHPQSPLLWRALARQERALGNAAAARAARRRARGSEPLSPEPAHPLAGQESPVPDDAGLLQEVTAGQEE